MRFDIVFLGPSLSRGEAEALLPDAMFLPPVQCGDVLRCLRLKPRRIAIIDGFFEHTAAVWHKEILAALDAGVPVYGASSMGALRAAECEPFGMQGVGWVFQQFRDGMLCDDDEVAVAHLPADLAYKPVSEAMVNIRRSLQMACEQGVLSQEKASALVSNSKALFYAQRSWSALCEASCLSGVERNKLAAWLESGGVVDQKAEDARALLRLLASQTELVLPPVMALNRSLPLRRLQRDVAIQALPYQTNLPEHERALQNAARDQSNFGLTQLVAGLIWDMLSVELVLPKKYKSTFLNIEKIPLTGLLPPLHDEVVHVLLDVNARVQAWQSPLAPTPIKLAQLAVLLELSDEQADALCEETLALAARLCAAINDFLQSQAIHPDDEALQQYVDTWRESTGLYDELATQDWLSRHDTDLDELVELMRLRMRLAYARISGFNKRVCNRPVLLAAACLSGLFQNSH